MVAPALVAQLRIHRVTDREIAKVMRDAALEAERMIKALEGKEGQGARVRRAQIELARIQVDAWASVGSATRSGVGDAFAAAGRLQALYDGPLLKAVGMSETAWKQSLVAQSQRGVESYLSRKHNGMTLSKRVYRNQALSRGYVDRVINNGLLLGKSAKEIADDVKRFIDPRTPGGASSAAMRLGRTEVGNAFHASAIRGYKETPWVDSVRWNLSGSHPRPDACNEYADQDEWSVDEVPDKPHPNCLCYTTPVPMGQAQYIRNFKSGQYDSYIDAQLRNAS